MKTISPTYQTIALNLSLKSPWIRLNATVVRIAIDSSLASVIWWIIAEDIIRGGSLMYALILAVESHFLDLLTYSSTLESILVRSPSFAPSKDVERDGTKNLP